MSWVCPEPVRNGLGSAQSTRHLSSLPPNYIIIAIRPLKKKLLSSPKDNLIDFKERGRKGEKH